MEHSLEGAVGHTDSVRCVRLTTPSARPALAVEWKDVQDLRALDDALLNVLLAALDTSELAMQPARAVPLSCLRAVLEAGVDVTPTDAVIYVDLLSKALEYGGTEKVIMFFDGGRLESTWREMDSSTGEDVLGPLRKTYPTELRSEDGRTVWLSRMPAGSRRVGSSYEVDYARWIPGDPHEALRGLILVGPSLEGLVDAYKRVVHNSAIAASRWPWFVAGDLQFPH